LTLLFFADILKKELSMQEKRKYPRYICSPERKFIAVYHNTDRQVGDVKDFSRSGIGLVCEDPLKDNEKIMLQLQIKGLGQKIPAVIQIVWSRPQEKNYTYGARLMQISPSSKFDIMDLLYQDWKRHTQSYVNA
jgi:hypothetical protein